jgi:poly [ADP-ribose] polymerase
MSNVSNVSALLIDEYCNNKGGKLVEEDKKIYNCTLNQTDLRSNKNKFYIMQLVEDGSTCVHFIRYGRLGEPGVINHKKFPDVSSAKAAFKRQFRTKTGNSWGDDFVKKSGKYFLTETSYEDELKKVNDSDIKKLSVPDSKLHQKVQDLIKMLSDINMMRNTLVQLDIDTKKMPLGKIKQSQLDLAKEALDSIQKSLQNKGKNGKIDDDVAEKIVDLSSQYYTYLPYACGRKKPPVINSSKTINNYRDILDDLRNIVVGVQIINDVQADENPIDAVYKNVKTDITPLSKRAKMYGELVKYVSNTHGPSHGCKLDVMEIFEISQQDKKAKYDKFCKDNNIANKMLLFHGTPQSCVLSIFQKDFYLDISKLKDMNVVQTGKMFGYGIYFADMVSKSFNYTRAYGTNDVACMILGEVAVGNMAERTKADYYINKDSLAKTGHHSTKGVGKIAPSSGVVTKDKVLIPNGKAEEVKRSTGLRYNEYIVYDIDQILIKYLVLVKNKGNYSGF